MQVFKRLKNLRHIEEFKHRVLVPFKSEICLRQSLNHHSLGKTKLRISNQNHPRRPHILKTKTFRDQTTQAVRQYMFSVSYDHVFFFNQGIKFPGLTWKMMCVLAYKTTYISNICMPFISFLIFFKFYLVFLKHIDSEHVQ